MLHFFHLSNCFKHWKCSSPSVKINAFFYKRNFFPTQPQRCLNFSRLKLQIFLRCCLIHITIIILRDLWFSFFFFFFIFNWFAIIHFYKQQQIGTLFIFTKSRFRWSIIHFHLHFHYDKSYNVMNTDTIVFEYFLLSFEWYCGWYRGWRVRLISK